MTSFDNWLSQLVQGGQFYRLFEHIPDLMFFVKDKESRLLMGNHRFLEHCGFPTVEALAGKLDQDIFPVYMAEKFRRDDQTVLQSGKPLLDLVELFPTRDRLPEWFVTHKYPLFDSNGQVEGVCGIVQNYEQDKEDRHDPVIKMVRFIKLNYASSLSIPELSKQAGLSQRQLERLFKKRFRISPREYIIRLRTLIAADQLSQNRKTITEIALECGFYDHSSFTRYFKRHMGCLPQAYRKEHSV
jgi:AraC-like DNA-binding protein